MSTQTLPTTRKPLSEVLEFITPEELFKKADQLFSDNDPSDYINLLFELYMREVEAGVCNDTTDKVYSLFDFLRDLQETHKNKKKDLDKRAA
jgi:hypothetical protein